MDFVSQFCKYFKEGKYKPLTYELSTEAPFWNMFANALDATGSAGF